MEAGPDVHVAQGPGALKLIGVLRIHGDPVGLEVEGDDPVEAVSDSNAQAPTAVSLAAPAPTGRPPAGGPPDSAPGWWISARPPTPGCGREGHQGAGADECSNTEGSPHDVASVSGSLSYLRRRAGRVEHPPVLRPVLRLQRYRMIARSTNSSTGSMRSSQKSKTSSVESMIRIKTSVSTKVSGAPVAPARSRVRRIPGHRGKEHCVQVEASGDGIVGTRQIHLEGVAAVAHQEIHFAPVARLALHPGDRPRMRKLREAIPISKSMSMVCS